MLACRVYGNEHSGHRNRFFSTAAPFPLLLAGRVERLKIPSEQLATAGSDGKDSAELEPQVDADDESAEVSGLSRPFGSSGRRGASSSGRGAKTVTWRSFPIWPLRRPECEVRDFTLQISLGDDKKSPLEHACSIFARKNRLCQTRIDVPFAFHDSAAARLSRTRTRRWNRRRC